MMFIVKEGKVLRVIEGKYLWNKSQLDAVAIMKNFIVLNDVKVFWGIFWMFMVGKFIDYWDKTDWLSF